VVASPVGIETSAQGSTHQTSTEHHAVTSGAHTSISAGKSLLVSVREAVRLFAYKAGMKLVAASGDIDITALKDSVNILAKLNITHTANRITITAKEEVVINGGTSFSRWNASGIVHGTNGIWREHAAQHSLVVGAAEGRPNLPVPTVLPLGQLDLSNQYVNSVGASVEPVKAGSYAVTDAEGGVHQGSLSGQGKTSVSGLPMGAAKIDFGKDPRNPWDEGSYFGKPDEWPKLSGSQVEEIAAAPAAGPAAAAASTAAKPAAASSAGFALAGAGAMGGAMATLATTQAAVAKVAPMAAVAQQGMGVAQALQQGAGAKALMGPMAQVAPIVGKQAGPVGELAVQALRDGPPTQQAMLAKALPSPLPSKPGLSLPNAPSAKAVLPKSTLV
jgi:type VI secretion system secreted protein VgrG